MMEAHKVSKTSNSETRDNDDIISSLPEAVIHLIFSFLEIVDVVRTSVLSRKWRYYWTSVPYLKLNLENSPYKLPWIIDFSVLKSLHLVKADLLDDETVQKLFSSFQVLKNLKIEACQFRSLEVLHICAATIKSFELVEDLFEEPENQQAIANGLCKIKLNVDCPNPASFIYMGNAVRNVYFPQTPSLEKAFICITAGPDQSDDEVGHILCDIARKFCTIKILKLSISSLWYFDFMYSNLECFSSSFCNLKFLMLQSCNDDLYRGIFSLL